MLSILANSGSVGCCGRGSPGEAANKAANKAARAVSREVAKEQEGSNGSSSSKSSSSLMLLPMAVRQAVISGETPNPH